MTNRERLAEIKARRADPDFRDIGYLLKDGEIADARKDFDWLLSELEAAWEREALRGREPKVFMGGPDGRTESWAINPPGDRDND